MYQSVFGKELDGVLIRNWEQYTLLCQLQFDKKVISDDNLYVFNRFSKEFMKKQVSLSLQRRQN